MRREAKLNNKKNRRFRIQAAQDRMETEATMVCKVTVCKIDDEIGGFWCQAEPRMGEEGKSSEMDGCSSR